MTDDLQCMPDLQPAKQVSYRESFARRMSGDISPLQPTDADMAVHAEALEEAARLQRAMRQRPIDDYVER